MLRILVTGSLGAIGAPLVEELRARGHDVWGCDLVHSHGEQYVRADVRSYRQLERLFQREYDFVYHLGAEFGRINGEEYYDTVWASNAIGTRNVLELQRRHGFRLIFASTSEIYGERGDELLTEDLPLEKPIFPENDYAISKWVNELQILNFQKRYDTETVRCRFFNVYGPGEYYHNYRSVVALFCYRALHDLPYEVYDGYYRVFTYVDDFIPTLANVVDNFRAGEVYNIASDDYRSVREASDIILGYLGKDDTLVSYLSLDRDAFNARLKRPDISKAKADLVHDHRTTLEEGIPKTIEWMKAVYGERGHVPPLGLRP